jgi:hypothetical protein
VTYDVLYGQGPRPQLTGSPIGTMRWLDQNHFVQTKEGVPYTITAASGRATVHADPIQSKAMAAVLMGLDGIDDATARAMTARKELLLRGMHALWP